MPRRRPIRRAFTLVELIAAMTVIATLGSMVSLVITTAVNGYTRGATTAQMNSEIGIALDRIDQLLRFVPRGSTGGPDIASVTATSITWSTNSTLSLSGTQLLLSEAGGTASVLLNDVSAFSIATYNESNTALSASLSGAACAPIRRIVITISLTRTGVTETLRTKIFLRSMMIGVS